MFGERYEYTDQEHQAILHDFDELLYLEGGVWAQVSFLCKQDSVSPCILITILEKVIFVKNKQTKNQNTKMCKSFFTSQLKTV